MSFNDWYDFKGAVKECRIKIISINGFQTIHSIRFYGSRVGLVPGIKWFCFYLVPNTINLITGDGGCSTNLVDGYYKSVPNIKHYLLRYGK